MKVIGQNNVEAFVNIPNVPNEIVESETGNYFILFDNLFSFNKQSVTKALATFQYDDAMVTNTVIDKFKSRNETVVFADLKAILMPLTRDEIATIERQKNVFKVVEDKKVSISNSSLIPPHEINTSIPINWGLLRTNAINSKLTGKGVKVAILDTGWDFGHPDYPTSRTIITNSFVGRSAQDDNGHGMHCAGIACGNTDTNGVRYGVAPDSDIYACKVLDINGNGQQSNIIMGIRWAVQQGCKVISMSIETQRIGSLYADPLYERAINDALNKNCLVISAAGNHSDRQTKYPEIITSPADSLGSWAINSIDYQNNIHNTANRADKALYQNMAYAAPGVQIYSSFSRHNGNNPNAYMTGTSMSTAFAAGIAALLWQNNLNDTPFQIYGKFRNMAHLFSVRWNKDDYGDGILQAPLN